MEMARLGIFPGTYGGFEYLHPHAGDVESQNDASLCQRLQPKAQHPCLNEQRRNEQEVEPRYGGMGWIKKARQDSQAQQQGPEQARPTLLRPKP